MDLAAVAPRPIPGGGPFRALVPAPRRRRYLRGHRRHLHDIGSAAGFPHRNVPLATEPPESCVSGDCGPDAAVKSSSLIEAAVEWAVEVTEGEGEALPVGSGDGAGAGAGANASGPRSSLSRSSSSSSSVWPVYSKVSGSPRSILSRNILCLDSFRGASSSSAIT